MIHISYQSRLSPRLAGFLLLIGIAFQAAVTPLAEGDEWMTWPSTYTHDGYGARIDQHSEPVQPIGPNRSDVVRSGFRHFRSTLQAGQSADNYHVTEQWGAPVVPYEHWRFPFRPFGVPYDQWGPPTPYGMFFGAGLGLPFWPPQGGPGMGGPGMGGPGMGRPGMGGPGMGGPGMGGNGWGGNGMGGNGWGGNGWGGNGWGGQHPRNPWQGPGNLGFPLQPNYQNQPWFDGTYPDAPPLDNRSDREFFWNPSR